MLDRYDQDLLLDYLEDELDADRRAEIDALVADDPQLAGLLVEMAKDRAALRSLPQAQAPAGLVHDTTHAMERQMLLDDTIEDAGPIPLSRGRALAAEPTRSISWGRVVGLTGLAASVALVAAVLVITFDDPLERTANELADNSPAEAEESAVDFFSSEAASTASAVEGLTARDTHDLNDASPGAAVAATPSDALANKPLGPLDEALARVDAPHRTTLGQPAATPEFGDFLNNSDPLAPAPALPTAAISAIQPQQQLMLFSESPKISLEQLITFCVANGIPVVQPEQMSFRLDDSAGFGSVEQAPLANAEANAQANAQTTTTADDDVAEYALLINEAQLNTLLASLNNDINIDPTRAGKASVISNQAAILTDLTAARDQLPARELEPSVLANRNLVQDAQAESAQQVALAPQRQAIQLRSPDLGSADANRRNAYNLKAQQQASYTQSAAYTQPDFTKPAAALALAESSATAPAGPERSLAKSDVQRLNTQEELAEADQADPQKRAALGSADQADPKQADGNAALEAQAPELEKKMQNLVIDPARGNWLSPHLPMANTTPLLLSWRERRVDRATKLVPVMIQQAEPNKVNTLRQRQQVELANRDKSSAADEDAKIKEAADDDAQDDQADQDKADDSAQ